MNIYLLFRFCLNFNNFTNFIFLLQNLYKLNLFKRSKIYLIYPNLILDNFDLMLIALASFIFTMIYIKSYIYILIFI